MRQEFVFFAWALAIGAGTFSFETTRAIAVENKLELPKIGGDKEEESWFGEFVVPRTADVRCFTLGAREQKTYIADLYEPYYQVLDDKDGRVVQWETRAKDAASPMPPPAPSCSISRGRAGVRRLALSAAAAANAAPSSGPASPPAAWQTARAQNHRPVRYGRRWPG